MMLCIFPKEIESKYVELKKKIGSVTATSNLDQYDMITEGILMLGLYNLSTYNKMDNRERCEMVQY